LPRPDGVVAELEESSLVLVKGGQVAMPPPFGSPVAAKRTQAELTVSASSWSQGSRGTQVWEARVSQTYGISMAW
jgi:hypothetical protein